MSRYVVAGMYWNAGDELFIDTQNDDNGWVSVCLNDLIKNNIKPNTKVTIVIDTEDKEVKFMLNSIMLRVVDLEVNPATPKRAKRKLQEILTEYEFDDDFISSIDDSTVNGFYAAINIVKDILQEKRNQED